MFPVHPRKTDLAGRPRRAALLFGRMNPPTIGHARAIRELERLAGEHDATPLVFLSRSESSDPKGKNPLPFAAKVSILHDALGVTVQNTNDESIRNPFDAVTSIDGQFDQVLIIGDGAITGVDWDHWNNDLWDFDWVGASTTGERLEDSHDAEVSVSASQVRALAMQGDDSSRELYDQLALLPDFSWPLVRAGLGFAS